LFAQDGLFDGLTKLTQLVLNTNQISSIGRNVFTGTANLTALMNIDLGDNKMTQLEPWPLIHGQLVPGSHVNLWYNRISKFTNQLGWGFKCGQSSIKMSVDMRDNNIQHVTDIMNGWNVIGNITLFSAHS
jgi:Leucine-rich repeat (LRR) protein